MMKNASNNVVEIEHAASQGNRYFASPGRVFCGIHLLFGQVIYLEYAYVFDSIGRGGAI
jgi:hypothetical protein